MINGAATRSSTRLGTTSWFYPGTGKASEGVVAIRVFEVEGLQAQSIWLQVAQFTGRKAFGRTFGELLEFFWMYPDSPGWEGDLDQHAIPD